MEVPAVPVGPFHHRGDGEPARARRGALGVADHAKEMPQKAGPIKSLSASPRAASRLIMDASFRSPRNVRLTQTFTSVRAVRHRPWPKSVRRHLDRLPVSGIKGTDDPILWRQTHRGAIPRRGRAPIPWYRAPGQAQARGSQRGESAGRLDGAARKPTGEAER